MKLFWINIGDSMIKALVKAETPKKALEKEMKRRGIQADIIKCNKATAMKEIRNKNSSKKVVVMTCAETNTTYYYILDNVWCYNNVKIRYDIAGIKGVYRVKTNMLFSTLEFYLNTCLLEIEAEINNPKNPVQYMVDKGMELDKASRFYTQFNFTKDYLVGFDEMILILGRQGKLIVCNGFGRDCKIETIEIKHK